ncbi:hypothetical protein N9151_00595 [bacterium]|nr:hypothetical protein [bacterium]
MRFRRDGQLRSDGRDVADIACKGPPSHAGSEALGDPHLRARNKPLTERLLFLDRGAAGRAVHQMTPYRAANAVGHLVVDEGRNEREDDLALNR